MVTDPPALNAGALPGNRRHRWENLPGGRPATVVITLRVITCATVFGGTAWFGGVVTSAGSRQGREVNFFAVDGGEGRKGFGDGISLIFVGAEGAEVAQPYCDNTPFDRGIFPTQGITIQSPGNTSFTVVETFPINIGVFIPCALDGAGEIAVLERHGIEIRDFRVPRLETDF